MIAMRKNMVLSSFNSIDDFIDEWLTDRRISKKYQHLAFIILENNDIRLTSCFKEPCTDAKNNLSTVIDID